MDSTEEAADLEGYWEGFHIVQVCKGMGQYSDEFELGCRSGFGGCACSSSVAIAHLRLVAIAHPRFVIDEKQTYDDDSIAHIDPQHPIVRLM